MALEPWETLSVLDWPSSYGGCCGEPCKGSELNLQWAKSQGRHAVCPVETGNEPPENQVPPMQLERFPAIGCRFCHIVGEKTPSIIFHTIAAMRNKTISVTPALDCLHMTAGTKPQWQRSTCDFRPWHSAIRFGTNDVSIFRNHTNFDSHVHIIYLCGWACVESASSWRLF